MYMGVGFTAGAGAFGGAGKLRGKAAHGVGDGVGVVGDLC